LTEPGQTNHQRWGTELSDIRMGKRFELAEPGPGLQRRTRTLHDLQEGGEDTKAAKANSMEKKNSLIDGEGY